MSTEVEVVESPTSDADQYLLALDEALTKLEAAEARLAELEPLVGQLRAARNLEAYREIAAELGVKPSAMSDLWKLADYQPESDEPDPRAIREHFSKFLETPGRKEMFTGTGQAEAPKARLTKGEGADRGGSREPNPRPSISRRQASDPEWMFAHQDAIAAASQAGNLPQITD